MGWNKELLELQNELYDLSVRNPFVHIKPERLWWGTEENEILDKIYTKARYYSNEYGLDTVLEVSHFIAWVPPGWGDDKKLISPLFYFPAYLKKQQRITVSYALEKISEQPQVNPVLRHYFKVFFELELPQEVDDPIVLIQEIQAYLNGDQKQLTFVDTFSLDENWCIMEAYAVGNFNYRKSALGADYNMFVEQPNDSIKRLFSGDYKTAEKACNYFPVLPLDQFQQAAVENALQNDYLIQGPPGTGKSHTIVGLIGGFLAQNKKVLFVSEKRAALEVVNHRLSTIGLGDLVAYFNTDKDQKKNFYKRLEMGWKNANDKSDVNTVLFSSRPHNTLIDYYNDFWLRQQGEIGLHTLVTTIFKEGLSVAELGLEGKAPSFAEWSEHYEELQRLERVLCKAFSVDTLGDTYFIGLSKAVFSEQDITGQLAKRLDNLEVTYAQIRVIQMEYELGDQLDEFIRLALTASILNMVDKIQIDLLNTASKKYKSFNTWAKKYQVLKTRLVHAEKANEKWTKKPSLSEITELLDLVRSQDQPQGSSIFRRLKRNPVRLKEAFKDFHSGIGNHTKIKLLESLQLEWRLRGELEEIKVKLKHNLNINDPDNEIDLIFNLRNKLDGLSQNEYLKILEHPQSVELIKALSQIHPDIVRFNSQKRLLFANQERVDLQLLSDKIKALIGNLGLMQHWLTELKQLFGLPGKVLNVLRNNTDSIAVLNSKIAYHELLRLTRFDPHFKQLSGDTLAQNFAAFGRELQAVCDGNIEAIKAEIRNTQLEKETLLAKPGYKLKPEQKDLKKKYKVAKRVLLHEINKKQRYLPVKKLLDHMEEDLLRLQPVWMMNPLTVSAYLPCIADLFDVVIFDEASQIPLEDAVPSIYRAKQVVIVGDDKQMPPASFFSNRSEIKTILDAARGIYKGEMLRWHYRSKHTALIQFSNQEFYQNELVGLPSDMTSSPIDWIYVENGNYQSGKNSNEAKVLVADLEAQIKDPAGRSILVITFSQEQEKEINRQLKSLGVSSDRIRIRNLENVQGAEADIVFISVGYGRSESGEFRLNFGPVNQVNGEKRLNVMFTRAIERMVVYSSVCAADFGWSDNRGVALLKDFLFYVEHNAVNNVTSGRLTPVHQYIHNLLSKHQVDFVYQSVENKLAVNAFINAKNGRVLLVDPGMGELETDDLVNLYSNLSRRFKRVKIVLALDIWLDKSRVDEAVLNFFME